MCIYTYIYIYMYIYVYIDRHASHKMNGFDIPIFVAKIPHLSYSATIALCFKCKSCSSTSNIIRGQNYENFGGVVNICAALGCIFCVFSVCTRDEPPQVISWFTNPITSLIYPYKHYLIKFSVNLASRGPCLVYIYKCTRCGYYIYLYIYIYEYAGVFL